MGEKLKAARLTAGLSQGQVAELTGISPRVLQNYEQGKRDINGARLSTLLTLCDVLGCGLGDIISDEETLVLIGKLCL